MTRVELLLRQYRWQLDERRQRLDDLDRLAQKLRHEARRLAESAVEGLPPEAGLAPAQRIRARRETIGQSLAAVEFERAEAEEAVNKAYQELARHEMMVARQSTRQRARGARPQDPPTKPSILAPRRSGQGG